MDHRAQAAGAAGQRAQQYDGAARGRGPQRSPASGREQDGEIHGQVLRFDGEQHPRAGGQRGRIRAQRQHHHGGAQQQPGGRLPLRERAPGGNGGEHTEYRQA